MKVSAIVTTFNRAKLLKPAIASVLAQTFSDFELIILDNSSTDDTERVVKSFNDARIVYVKHPPLGISAARNLGVKTARGEYFGFLDDDDEWLPQKLTLQVGLFQKLSPLTALIYGGFVRVRSDGMTVYETFIPTLRGNVLERYLCEQNPLTGSASNPLIRKSACDAIGGYSEKIKTSEDWEFYLRLARDYEFDFIDVPVIKIRQHSGPRLGDRLEDAAAVEMLVLEEFADIFAKRPECHSYYLQTIGGKLCRVGKAREGRAYLRRAIRLNLKNILAYAQYALSFLGPSLYMKFHKIYKRFKK